MDPRFEERQAQWEAANAPVWGVHGEPNRVAVTFCGETVRVWSRITPRAWSLTFYAYGIDLPASVDAEAGRKRDL